MDFLLSILPFTPDGALVLCLTAVAWRLRTLAREARVVRGEMEEHKQLAQEAASLASRLAATEQRLLAAERRGADLDRTLRDMLRVLS